MKRATGVLWLFPLLALVAGCFTVPATTQEAAKAAEDFMIARAEGDAKTVWSMLTPKAQKAISRDRVAATLQAQRITWDRIGTATEVDAGLIQIPVHNLRVRGESYEQTWPEDRLTLVHDGKRWRVAWVDPLLDVAAADYRDHNYADELDLGRTISQIDPQHYRGPLEMFFAYWGLDRYREADMALTMAMEKALPYQLPAVHDATARFKLWINQPDDAIRFARLALDEAAPYVPATYSKAWQADVQVVLGMAQLHKGSRAEAEAAAKLAAEIDPANGSLATFRWMLAQSIPPTTAASTPQKP